MKAYGYGRYSTDHQDQNSLAYQMAEIQKYCRNNGITLCGFYTDEAESGTNMDRPGFQALLAAARRREIDAVIIYDISRGSRDVGDWFSFRRSMLSLGIKVISATQNLGDITNPNDFIVELITAGMGQHDVLADRQKSIDGVAVKARQGAFLGGVPPLGYDIVNGQYVVNEPEAAAVRTIFAMYADGKSYNAIIEALKGARGKRGRPIGKNSLSSILRNERYIGTYTWNKRKCKVLRKWAGGAPNPNVVKLEGFIQPIIDKELWERVQKRLKENKHNASNKAKHDYLLTGLIECESCGSTYVGHCSTNSRGYSTRYYLCGNKYRTRTCKSKNINADEIETFVVQHLKNYLLTADYSALAQYIANEINNVGPDLSVEKKELSGIITKISNGVNAILAGAQIPELEQELDRLRVRRDELQGIIQRAAANQSKVSPESIVALFRSAAEHISDDPRRVIKQFVTKIYAHIDGSFTVNIGVHMDGCGRGI